MAIFVAALVMALLGTFTIWLPWAARRSDVLDRLIDILAMAGQHAPLLGRETLAWPETLGWSQSPASLGTSCD